MDVGLLAHRMYVMHDAVRQVVDAMLDGDEDEVVSAAVTQLVDRWCALGTLIVDEYAEVET